MNNELKKLIDFSKKLSVLYAEDDKDAREQTLKMLENFFDNITVAKDGKEALDEYVKTGTHFDLIITDINMPKINGLELLLAIRKIDADIPCIILSAHNDEKLFLKSIKIGVDGYIIKPLETPQLVQVFQKIISRLLVLDENRKQQIELEELYLDSKSQQHIAKEKLEATIVNDLLDDSSYKIDIIYKPLDIVSGDFYSVYKLDDGSKFIYILDGQGHGVSPALTVFAISSTIANIINKTQNFDEITQKLFTAIQCFLGEYEQVSYTIIRVSANHKELQYVAGGMYPFLVKDSKGIIKTYANNVPFMNFSEIPTIKTLSFQNIDSLLLYSDGLVESDDDNLCDITTTQLLVDDTYVKQAKELIECNRYEDDITVIKITF